MKKSGLGTAISAALNVFLSFWLVNNYFYDEPFRNYVNITINQIYPFLVLTLGLGGGSGLGYLLLRRRHPEQTLSSKLQKGKLPRPGAPLPSPIGVASSQSKNMPTGVPAGQTSRQLAYAVPPLPKSPAPSGQRTVPSTSWSTPEKPSPPTSSQTLRVEQPPLSTSRPQSELAFRMPQPSQWRPEQTPPGERRMETSKVYPKPPLDMQQRQETPSLGQPSGQGPQQPPPFQPPRWQAPETTPGTTQWTNPVPRPEYSGPQKWTPPSGAGTGLQSQPPTGLPGPGPVPPRPQISPRPEAQRPLTYPGPSRPGEGGPMGFPRPFRPDQGRPPQGPGQQPLRPPPLVPRPMPQQWTPPPVERGQPGGTPGQERSISPPPAMTKSPRTSEPKTSMEEPESREMDWDTALDTILKTLRKDKVKEEQ